MLSKVKTKRIEETSHPMFKLNYLHLLRFIKYTMVAGFSALIDFSVFAFSFKIFSLNIFISNLIAFICALSVGFYFQKNWTFKDDRKETLALSFRFLCVVGTGLLLKMILMYLFVRVIGIYALFAKPLEIGIVFFWNFTGNNFWVFNKRANYVLKNGDSKTSLRS